ncbi:uncharacterized protein LOC129746034 isoform X1 [Uranotaenia lowii]|uniref:uncharacterized protein LOC129746034 isoform X1 n=1 Tax=Uranotaenia lowii TaxID=190385 RepID=UPI002478C14E|nr:uncharacterized protein LOC129746034 isoform X1 [Uranotaenia lowii]XP_055595428.1 uncharacterized protein LOC129746034 isoform X1 [Uranotaenia lowii]XP_055595429.1 uncharacterized protein LOC129746034 isoform X1 [Uranotaenia lowii]XP_055595430.1 uncharacterized protein LOC129746034 isoform X1 [Uranotaenia lowii]
MFVLKVKVKNMLTMKIEIRNLFLLTMVTALLNLAAPALAASGDSFLSLDEFNSSPTRHNHRHHPASQQQLQEHQHQQHPRDNFILIDYLSDGERERRISWNGIAGKETSVGDVSKSLSLWQLSDATKFIQMIFTSDGQLMDCEFLRQKHTISTFRQRFYGEIEQARSRNFSSPLPVRHSLVSDHDFREFLDNGIMTSEMEDLQYSVQEFADGSKAALESDAFGLRNLTYIPLRDEADIPKDILKMLNFRRLKAQCDERHEKMRDIAHGLQSEDAEQRQEADQTLQSRQRRDLSSMLRVPGTKWCGKGWSARNYVEMGGLSKADRCCRQHDLSCPFWILGFETKYGVFNWRVNTLMHCSCDERFRTCLKMADSSDANMVGKLFFNIVQSKCFVLKPETVCTKTSWWGKCEKKVRRKRAHIRDNRKY